MSEPDRSPERQLAYLRQLAARDWGPGGNGCLTCFQAIPALELERRGESAGVYRWEWIDNSLDLLRRRKDCQDFAMVCLLRMLQRYPSSRLLTPAHRTEIEATLLAAKYDDQDPGEDTCCWHTENHQVQYASSELLMGQRFPDTTFANSAKRGCWHRERAREKLFLWLDWRRRFSFSEWNSSCYYDEDAAALLNVVEYAEDGELRRQAVLVLELLFLHVAANSWRGLIGGSQGRAYRPDAIAPDETAMAAVAQIGWGDGPVPAKLSRAAVFLATGTFAVPPAVVALGRDLRPEGCENRERHSLDAEEGAGFGVFPDRLRDYPFYMAAGLDHHHLVVESGYAYHNGQEKWPGFFSDRDYYRRCRVQGLPINTRSLPIACGRAEVYTFRTTDYMLGCAQAFRPGSPGYQQLIWSATLGRRAVVFTTNPAPADVPYGRPGPWVGNGVLPKVVQHRNVLLALHRVQPCPIYDQPPWFREDRVHAWFPRGAFDEVREENGWCFGRKDGGYIGLRPLKPAAWVPPQDDLAAQIGSAEPYEWEVRDTEVAWICELGSAHSHGGFAEFVRALVAARVEGDTTRVRFASPSLGLVESGWDLDLTVAGAPVATRDYPLMANDHVRAPFGTPWPGLAI